MLQTGDAATYKDRLSKKIFIVRVHEPVVLMVGRVRVGDGFAVEDIVTGHHLVVPTDRLRPIKGA